MRRLVLMVLLGLVLANGYILSPFSYVHITFQQPLSPNEYLAYLSENGINPGEHKVYVLNSSLERAEAIFELDFQPKEAKLIHDTVLNTKPYAINALLDQRVSSWSFVGPKHPYN